MIDLSLMKAIRVDPAAGTARAAGGVLLGELDRATQRFGLATTGGIISHTGIGGLTLGGGLGHLMRKLGLTVDNLLAVDLVTADGQRLRVDAGTEPELFWGSAAAAGTSGSPSPSSTGCTPGRSCSAGRSSGPGRRPRGAPLRPETSPSQAPDELGLAMFARLAPPGRWCPRALRPAGPGAGPGWAGDPAEGLGALPRCAGSAGPWPTTCGPLPYLFLQSMVDGGNQHGLRYYWRSQRIPELRDEVIDVVAGLTDTITSPLSYVAGFVMGGAAGRVDPEATAVGERGHGFELQHPRRLAAARPRRRPPRRLGPPRLDRPAPPQRGGLLALPLRRGPRRRGGRLRRATAAADRPQGPLGPGQLLPHERQHPAQPPARRADKERDAMSTVLVTGATGNVGSRVVQELRGHGVAARAFVRDPGRAAAILGPEVRAGRRRLRRPGLGRDRPPGDRHPLPPCGNLPPQVAYETGVIDAAARAGVRRLVKLSALGAEPGSPVAFWDWHARTRSICGPRGSRPSSSAPGSS